MRGEGDTAGFKVRSYVEFSSCPAPLVWVAQDRVRGSVTAAGAFDRLGNRLARRLRMVRKKVWRSASGTLGFRCLLS